MAGLQTILGLLICLLSVMSEASILRKGYMGNYRSDQNVQPRASSPVNKHYYTDYILNNQLHQARQRALVPDLVTGSRNHGASSYSGYFTVNKTCDSNLFTWFFPAANKSAPVLLWLQGGPGASSLFGLFVEHGPYVVTKDLKLYQRQFAWTNQYSVLYIDSPVGTGFSYTGKDGCYARNEDMVANDLYITLLQFFSVFKEYKQNDFYVTGESYGGKYVPALAYKIHTNKDTAAKYFNFKGVAIGNGLTDPINQLEYAALLYQIGLVDEKQRYQMQLLQTKAKIAINASDWVTAFNSFNQLIDGDLNTTSLFYNYTGMSYYFNFKNTAQPEDMNYYIDYLNQQSVRKLIHVGNQTYSDGSNVESHMVSDIPQSIRSKFEVIMDNYKTLVYNGQFDLIVAPVLTENYLLFANWTGSNDYVNAPRTVWKVDQNDTEIAGYVKTVKQFHYVLVRAGGHMVPYDQPRAAYDLITKFINNQL